MSESTSESKMGILMKSMVHVQAIHVQGHIIVTGLLEISENAENRLVKMDNSLYDIIIMYICG